jgi:hypothetical protein
VLFLEKYLNELSKENAMHAIGKYEHYPNYSKFLAHELSIGT